MSLPLRTVCGVEFQEVRLVWPRQYLLTCRKVVWNRRNQTSSKRRVCLSGWVGFFRAFRCFIHIPAGTMLGQSYGCMAFFGVLGPVMTRTLLINLS